MSRRLWEVQSHGRDHCGDGLKLIGRDAKKNPVFSAFDWTPEAAGRVLQVPHGFMRDRTQTRVEELATKQGAAIIDLQLVEDGVEAGRVMMEEMVKEQDAANGDAGNGSNGKKGDAQAASATAAEGKCPFSSAVEKSEGNVGLYLNEVGLMSELEARRKKN